MENIKIKILLGVFVSTRSEDPFPIGRVLNYLPLQIQLIRNVELLDILEKTKFENHCINFERHLKNLINLKTEMVFCRINITYSF